jgi:hypothetical protein
MAGLAGIAILALVAVVLFVLAAMEATQIFVLLILVMGLMLLGMTKQCYDEFCLCYSGKEQLQFFSTKSVRMFFSVIAGAVITFFLSWNLGFGPVIAASVIGLIAGILFPDYAPAAYCGSFVGMVSHDISNGYLFLLVCAVIAGALYIASSCVLNGFGGKLGAIAFTGCLFAALLFGRNLLSEPVPNIRLSLLIILFSILASLLTYMINIRLQRGPVVASALTGLAGGLIFPVLFPEIGSMIAIIFICASFAGMSSKERIPNEYLAGIAGLFAALAYIFSSPYLGGAGGKLGTIAFGSTLAASGLYTVYLFIKKKPKNKSL